MACDVWGQRKSWKIKLCFEQTERMRKTSQDYQIYIQFNDYLPKNGHSKSGFIWKYLQIAYVLVVQMISSLNLQTQ